MTMTVESTTPSAWVGCLSCYNDGDLVGKWLSDPDEIREYRCPLPVTIYNLHEELWVMDHENLPGMTGECSPTEFADRAEAWLALIEDRDAVVVAAYIDNVGINYVDWDTVGDDIDEAYVGEWESVEDYATEFMHDGYGEPEDPYAPYIDYESIARDMVLGGEIWTHEVAYKSIHVFRNIQ
jgi:antirestriction protein